MKLGLGKVYLIGAGPGDASLITVKGMDTLVQMDVIVYDELVNTQMFRSIPSQCRLVYAGKKAKRKHVSQQEINRMLVAYARKGLRVGRLKGGDPYLFGRGAEEGQYLHEHGIPFEVIPGVTSALGCAAYAGIPLTDRKLSSGVAFITGHRAAARNGQSIPWKALLDTANTIVIYMGVTKLSEIQKHLLAQHCPKKTPMAIVQWGTWDKQKSCQGTLENIVKLAKHYSITSPAILVVGEVVTMTQTLNWFEKQPHFSKKIIITRSRSQSGTMCERLQSMGAEVIELPTISIAAPKKYTEMDQVIQRIGYFDWLVFTSVNGVDSFIKRLFEKHEKDARVFSSAKIAAVGIATKNRLRNYGIFCDFVPRQFTTESLFRELQLKYGPLQGKRFLLLRPSIAPEGLNRNLQKAGVNVTQVAVYETHCPKVEIRKKVRQIQKQKVDMITFSSSSTVNNLIEALGRVDARRFLKKLAVFSIGPVTSQCLANHKIKMTREADIATVSGLIDAMVESVS